VRTAIAVLMTHFPRIDETFILREINELERRGQPVVVVPLVRVFPRVVHEEAKPWVRRAVFTPLLSLAIVRSNLRTLFEKPRAYLRTLATIIAKAVWRPSTLVRSLALFPKAVHLARTLTAMGVKHIHSHFASHSTTAAWVISSVSDISYSFTVHGPDVFVHRTLLREKIAGAKFIRCISTFNKAFLGGLYPHLSQGKLEVVRTGVNPEVYAEASHFADRRARKASVQVLSVAALTRSRGFPVLIDACARLIQSGVDLELKIVGDGSLRRVTEQWIARHGLSDRVRILGVLPQHEVARLMGEADIFVFPSIIATDGQMDGIPISLMEAMAAGKPVVASAISGIPELVRDEVNGLLVDAAYPQRIESAMRRLIDDPALRERLGQAGRQTVQQHFDVRRTSTSLMSLLDRTAEVNEPSPSTSDRIRALNWRRLGAVGIGIRRLHERTEAYVAEVALSDGAAKRDVVVRQHRSSDPAESLKRAQNEFEVLTTLAGSMGDSVPRLLMFDEPNAAIVVERADGMSLAGIMREGRKRGRIQRVRVALRKIGTWLRLLQQHTRRDDDGRYVLTAIVLLAIRDLELAAAGDRLLRRHYSWIRDRLRELESRAVDEPMPVVGRHGNFRPDNIFIGERRVDVIDFSGFREGLPVEDVAELLVHTELAFATPVLRRRHLAHLQREIVNGFDTRADGAALRLCTAAAALRTLCCLGEDSPARLWWRRRALRQIVARSLA
jgi:glycosyltransferase involved in cell wall biosynthesis/aminoglycoside phosphotransferase (APT) family kinase protein